MFSSPKDLQASTGTGRYRTCAINPEYQKSSFLLTVKNTARQVSAISVLDKTEAAKKEFHVCLKIVSIMYRYRTGTYLILFWRSFSKSIQLVRYLQISLNLS